VNVQFPKLRRDLIVRQQQTAYGTSVIVKHPASGKFFQLEEAEHFIAQQLDGETSLDLIQQRTEAKFDAQLPIETLYGFIQTLKKNSLLETEDGVERDAGRRPKRFRGGPLFFRFKIFDPCELLKRLVRRTGFFYTPYFGVLSATTILLAAGTAVAHWADFKHDVRGLYHVSAIPMILALNFLVVGLHEFAHGLTCTRFGGDVHEMGCAMIFLQPAFYCNVSDAWLFPEKSKRLWVGFAGPYFELFLWALATLTWWFTETDTWINLAAVCVMATSGVKTLLNFNPLLKLDGYYLLSDYLEIPNLRRRSFRYVGNLVEKLFGFGSAQEEEESISPRERRVFSVYGTIALTGSFSILGYILVSAGATLVAGRTPTAVLISLLLLAMKFRRRFRRMFADTSGASGSFDDWDFDTADESTQADEPPISKGSGHFKLAEEEKPFRDPVRATNANGANASAVVTIFDKIASAKRGGHSEVPTPNTTSQGVPGTIYGSRTRERLNNSSGASPLSEESGNFATPPHHPSPVTESAVSDHDSGFQTSVAQKESKNSTTPGAASRVNQSPVPDQHNRNNKTAESSQLQKPAKSEEKKKGRFGRIVLRTVWLALAAAAVVALFRFYSEAQASGPLNILPVRNADVRTEIDGMIEQVRVSEGAIVRKGDLVARLSVRENRSELEKTQGQIQQSSAKLRLQVAGPTPDEIDLAKTAVVKAKDNLNFAQVKLKATKELFANNLTARLELDTAEQQFLTAKDDLADAEGKLKVMLNGTRPEEIDQTKAEISSLQVQQHFLEGQIHRAEVRSPVDGIVATPELQLKELVGQVVPKGALIAKVFELEKITVEIGVPESEIADVNVGQSVALRVRAYPNRTFNGVVTSVATSAFSETSSSDSGSLAPVVHSSPAASGPAKTVLVTTQIDNSSLLLKPGMTGQAKIFCGRRRLIDLVTRRLARTIKVEFWSWW
jgi:multidrug resistance efflux pump